MIVETDFGVTPHPALHPDSLLAIFHQEYRAIRPRAVIPEIEVVFFRFANLNNTIRLRDGQILVRLSDILGGAPDGILRSIAHILLAKLYRQPVSRVYSTRYHRHISSRSVMEKSQLIRRIRGRKTIRSAAGEIYDLDSIFDDLNLRFFNQLLARPQMTWSPGRSRYLLGHYDPAHNAIVVSRVLDDIKVPKFVVEYLVYHEMLHLRHPVRLRGNRRCIHPQVFVSEEQRFPRLAEAKIFLKKQL